jgi:peptidoglycan/LPS O-acetylase OafA/YrhL
LSEAHRSQWLQYRPEIDGIRALAVLAVVLYHAELGPSAGLVGVDVFFVISGYLITSLLCRERELTGRIDLVAFYARRIRRILPALVAVVLATVAASMILLSPFGSRLGLAHSATASLLFVGNLYFQETTGGYFDPDSNLLPLLHLWSLSVEEQFYVIWPILLGAVLHLQPRLRITLISLLAFASLTLAEVLISTGSNAAFYQMPARFWELALGGGVALRPAGRQRDGRLAIILGLMLVLAAAFVPTGHFPGLGALPAVAGAGAMLYAIHGSSTLGAVGTLLRSRPLVFVGLVSYSLYLWHWPLLALYRSSQVGAPSMVARTVLVLVAMTLAWLSFRFVETPWRRPDPRTTSARVVESGLLMLASLALAAINVGNFFHQEPPPTDPASRASRDWPSIRIDCHYGAHQGIEDFPRPGCISAADKPVRVVIWGDSHAMAWQPMAWALAQRDGVAAAAFTRDACAPALGYDNGLSRDVAAACREFNARVFEQVSLGNVDTLLLTARWLEGARGDNLHQAFETTLERLMPQVRRIILLGPTPYLRDGAPRCIEAGNEDACAVSRSSFEKQYGVSRQFLAALAARHDSVEYVDLTDFFCGRDTCGVIKDDYSLYWDADHVSTTAASRFTSQYLAKTHSDGQKREISNLGR